MNHLLENYRSELEQIRFAPIYGALSSCYEELNNPQSNGSSNMTEDLSSRPRDTWLGVDRQEEAYFNDDDEEDDHSNEAIEDHHEHAHEHDQEHNQEHDQEHDHKTALRQSVDMTSRGEMSPKHQTEEVMDIPHQMEATWLDDLEPNKRMKY